MADIVQIRRDTASNWTSADPTLANGEQGYETDTGKMKIGDGVTAWTSLSYFGGSGQEIVASTLVVAAAQLNGCKDPLRADYQSDGTSDQSEINTAIGALPT